jgi:2-(1,2-epoxy-1,2-dihydrophenyl)acetyl-CoA isomerase
MDYSTIIYSVADGIARLTINRPDRLNALLTVSYHEMLDALKRVEDDPCVRVLLLTGQGSAFCVGQDLEERKRVPGDAPRDLGESLLERVNPIIRAIAALRVPVVCAVNGVAAGAGANLALACDMVIARHGARFVQAFSKIGLVPDAGGTWWVTRLAGQARALGMMLTAEPVEARTAESWGLIWKAVAEDQFETDVEALLHRLAGGPPLALAATKALVRGSGPSLDAQLDMEAQMQRKMGFSDDYREGVAAFYEKRPPVFRNQ